MGILGGLAAGLSGAPGGFIKGREAAQQLDTGQINAAGQAAAGNALAALFNAPVPGAQPMPPGPGQASQPMQQPQQQGPMAALQGLLMRLQGGGAPQPQGQTQPPPGMPPQAGPPRPAMVPGAQPMPGAGPPQPQPQAMPPQGQPQGGQPGGAPQGQPQMTWQSVVQAVIKSNPGIKDPRVISAAVDRFMPLMNQQSQMEWKQVMMHIRQQNADTSTFRADTAADQGQQRIEQGQERVGIAQQQADTSKERAATSARQGDERIGIAKGRESRLERSAEVRQDQAVQRLDISRQQLQQRILQGNQRNLLGQWRAVVDAQHKRAQEIISSQQAGMSGPERKKLIDEEDKFYKGQIEEMKRQVEGGGQQGGGSEQTRPGAQGMALPEAFKNDPDGTTYEKDGKHWTKQGNQLVPAQ